MTSLTFLIALDLLIFAHILIESFTALGLGADFFDFSQIVAVSLCSTGKKKKENKEKNCSQLIDAP